MTARDALRTVVGLAVLAAIAAGLYAVGAWAVPGAGVVLRFGVGGLIALVAVCAIGMCTFVVLAAHAIGDEIAGRWR